MKTFSIKTLGCKVNQYESQFIRETFLKNGFRERNEKEPADIYVINTCTVTHHADKDSRYAIRTSFRENPKSRIVVTGCLTERDFDIISKIEGVTDIVRNSDKKRTVSILTGDSKIKACDTISGFSGHDRAFVKVQDGCNNYCSYCKVPLVRGRSVSRPAEDIKKEVTALLESGFKEIVLTGICLGAWGEDLTGAPSLADILEELTKLDGQFRIRLSSIELKYVTDRLLKMMAASKKICRHLHIPLQSGDDHILKSMKRPYTRDEFLGGIERIKSFVPDIGLTTDIMVGFPGEDESHFEDTLDLIKKFKPHRIHIFSYSRRKGTKASSLKETVSRDVLKKRAGRLRSLALELSYEYRSGYLGKEVEVLVEDKRDKETKLLTGYADTYIKVLLEGADSLKGALIKCRISKVDYDYTLAHNI